MKFTFIKPVDEPVNCYTGDLISTGDVVELSGHLAEKAKRNPNYQQVKPGPKRGDQSRNT